MSDWSLKSLFVAMAIAFALTTVAPINGALAGGAEVKFEGRLEAAAGDLSGKAKFEQRDGRRKFSAEVEGLVPGEMYDVVVAGAIVGKVVINGAGIGDLNFDTNFEPGLDDPATQFPGNFPMLDGGESVTVGPLSGTLQAK
jgi:hypothetical protein